MTVVNLDFRGVRRNREERLIALADALTETIGEDVLEVGPIDTADLLAREAELASTEAADIFISYRFAVGRITGCVGQNVDLDAYLDPDHHALTFAWALDYVARVNHAFDMHLGSRR